MIGRQRARLGQGRRLAARAAPRPRRLPRRRSPPAVRGVSKAADGRSSIHPRPRRQRLGGLGVDRHRPRDGQTRPASTSADGPRPRSTPRSRHSNAPATAARSITGPDTTLSAYLDKWVAARTAVVPAEHAGGLSHRPASTSRRSGVGRVKLRALSAEHIERIYAAVLASGCSTGSVAHVRRTLSAALNTAARRGHIAAQPGPARRHAARRRRGGTRALRRRARSARCSSAARGRRNGARWSLAFLGLRQGEALGLRWTDVDLDAASSASVTR